VSGLLEPVFAVVRWGWRQRRRFLKFGVVGVSGVAINQVAIWACMNWVFGAVEPASLRLNLSMAVGILLGMTNNFHWNRRWTWKDRERTQALPIVQQYLQYAAANWAGIVVQVAITNLLAAHMPYLLANLFGIGVACVINFLLNDLWTYRHVRVEGVDPEADRLERARQAVPLLITGAILAACTYLYGIGSLHILRNGDELVYMQITRVTAATGHWLPLQSDMPDMRNTKPPLLFWQGLLSTDWGRHWSLVALRWPSVVWSFLTAIMTGALAWRLAGRDLLKGVTAGLVYLAFFSTFRYGRPYLTNPPETFWVFACFFTMLWWAPRSFASRFAVPTAVGLLAGMALLTKSFAQLAPIGLGLAWWHLIERDWRLGDFVRRSAPGLAWIAALSLGVFALWFALDPEPAAIWREFVMGENVGKMGSSGFAGWLGGLLWSGSSVWTLAAGWFTNAGLLAFPLFGVAVECWKRRADLSRAERMLWAWVFALFLVFCLPSQRSERYLLEGMPALAVLMALRLHHVGRNASMIALFVGAGVFVSVGWVSLSLVRELPEHPFEWWHWVLLAGGLGLSVVALLKPSWTAISVPPVALGVYLALSSFLAVFDAPLGAYDRQICDRLAGRVVWVPEDFRSVAELDRFLLPGSEVRGYPASQGRPVDGGVGPDDFVVLSLPLREAPPAGALGSRIDLAGRHSPGQIWEMATGWVSEHLFRRCWVVPASSLGSK
jgi:putative flippase GtrA/4-amino-4-deoxy-L-arabinose transferase-like glycosyltransferase